MKRPLRYTLTTVFCIVVTVAVIFLRGIAKAEDKIQVFLCLSDGFFVAGALALLCGAFAFISRQGLIDAFLYTMRKIWVSLHSKTYRENHKLTYIEYREKKRKTPKPLTHFLIVGGIFLLVGVAFTIAFYYA